MMSQSPASRPFEAALSVISAMALIGLIDNTVIYIAEIAGIWQFHFCRAVLALIIVLLVARVIGGRLRPVNIWAVAMRSALISTSMILYFGALAFLTVPETAAGLFASPIFVVLISGLILGHRIPGANILAVIIGFCGVLFVLQPDLAAFSPAKLMPVCAAIFYAIGAIVTRGPCRQETTLTLLFGFFIGLLVWGALGLIALSVWSVETADGADGFMTRGWQAITGDFALWTTVQAVGSVIGVGLLTRAYLLAEAYFVAVFEYSILITAAFWGWLIWGQTLTPLAWVGFALLICSGLLLSHTQRLANRTAKA